MRLEQLLVTCRLRPTIEIGKQRIVSIKLNNDLFSKPDSIINGIKRDL